MTHVFISYARHDERLARQLERALTDAGFSTFLDQNPGNGIAAGADWVDELHRALARTGAIVYISGAASAASPWCQAELLNAYWLGKLIIPVQIDGTEWPLSQRIQAIRLSTSPDDTWARVIELLQSQFPFASSTRRISGKANPYPGLRSFDESEAELFFGRSELADEIIRRLIAPLAVPDEFMLAISGPSGCGKSSLVKARILPLLRIRPEDVSCVGPIEPAALLNEESTSTSTHYPIHSLLSGNYPDVTRGPTRVVFILDQAERLITEYGNTARLLVSELEQLARHNAWFRCLVIFRSDIMASSAVDELFGRYLSRPVRVPVLQRAEMRLSISEPARLAGIRFEQGLIDRVLDDAGSGKALPLLAYCLWNLAEMSGTERVISRHLYVESGGVPATLRQQAKGALDELEMRGIPADQVLATLLRLVTLNPDQPPTAKNVHSGALTELDRQILEAFVVRKLVVKDSTRNAETYQVAHEELLRWPELSGYIDQHSIELLVLENLEQRAHAWTLGKQELLEGPDLVHARYFQLHGLSSARLQSLTDASRVSDRPLLMTRITRPIVLFYGLFYLFFGLAYVTVLALQLFAHAELREPAGSALLLVLTAGEVLTYLLVIRVRFRVSRFGYYCIEGPPCDAWSYVKRWLLFPAGLLLTPFHRSFVETRLTWVDQMTHTELVAITRRGTRKNAARAPGLGGLAANVDE